MAASTITVILRKHPPHRAEEIPRIVRAYQTVVVDVSARKRQDLLESARTHVAVRITWYR
ncbi:MAG: hypothetical protein QF735_08685 [Phycisphaeraceae bacterium]|jgi:hypothetical protein|nr:hypothetical protein [Phycisphaeraceae bacterium]